MKIAFDLSYAQTLALSIAILFLLADTTSLTAQTVGDPNGGQAERQNSIDQNILRWEIFLGSVAQDAKTAFPEERRVYPTVEAANAYWEFDPDKSRTLYISAMDTAISLTRQDTKYQPLINYIISSAARLDGDLTNALNKRLTDAELKLPDDFRLDSAYDLIESDPETAARLAEILAPVGAENGSAMSFIYQLARKEKRLSDRVYGVYLQRISADPTISLGAVDFFAGYAFGYSEFCGINSNGGSIYNMLGPNRTLSGPRLFSEPFLRLASAKTATAIDQRNRAIGEELKNLNFQIAFTFEYMMPEIARFSPGTVAVWQQLQQQGMAGITAPEIAHARELVQTIRQIRAQNQTETESPQSAEQDLEASLDDIEKMTGTCQRDAAYSKAAMRLGGRFKNFKKAFEAAGKIETPAQEEKVIEFISIQMADNAIKTGDVDVDKLIEKISNPEKNALLRAELANETKDRQRIDEAIRLADKLEKPETRAGLLFGLSTTMLGSDISEAQSVLSRAIKALGQTEPTDKMKFSLSLSVLVGCDGEMSYYAWSKSIPNSTIFDAISVFAKKDPDTASRLADDIGDKITKLRAQAMIAKIALAELGKQKKLLQASK